MTRIRPSGLLPPPAKAGYDSGSAAGGRPINNTLRAILTIFFVAGLFMGLLGLVRVPFAVRFWRRMQWVAWVYIAVVIFSALRFWFFS